ncbi:oligopeptide transport system substrate-binding protein [Bacillus capparidis]|uniref:Oligopeptide transport system substrate-binding protein n=1 Tax=Bacillus capparidis TaxID=1840411 RepID=A0ABS4CPX0_9BACI|nr:MULTISPECIES: peptide ABC transporter substrate-binding protein [Bacillus]MBP1079624.1 oligopeptide transport system substrate-binding protein [Bacillus capparidis]
MLKKSKFSLLLALALVFSLVLSACGYGGSSEDSGDKKQEAVILESAELPDMDSVKATDTVSFTTLNNVMEGLYRMDQNQEPIPAIADGEPEVNEDKTVYTFKLRDTKWSNGDPVTANDFVYAWQRSLDPKTESDYGPYMMSGKIKNADKVYAGKAKPSELGIKAIDDKTLEITLEKPIPFIESLLAFPTFYPQNQKFIEEKGDNYAKNAENLVYNGPYTLAKWEGSQATTWQYAKNDQYWDKDNVSMNKITFNVSKDPQAAANAFEAGEADVTPKLSTAAVLEKYQDDNRKVQWLEPTIFWLKMNQKNEALANENIRRAIAMSFDKEALVNDVLQNGSVPAYYEVPQDFVKDESGKDFRENGDFLKMNKEEAKKLFAQGLKELGQSEVTINYLGDDTESAKTIASYMKDQLEGTLDGLTLNIQSVPFATRIDRDTSENYDLQVAGWGPDYLDPITFSDLFITDGGNNHMNYSNKKYDQLINDAQNKLADKPEERWATLQEAEKVLLEEDAALAPIYQRSSNVLVSDKLEGFTYHLVGPEYSYKWLKVK